MHMSRYSICFYCKITTILCKCIYSTLPSTNAFIDDFPDFLETTLQFQENLYMFGDFNIHLYLPTLNTRFFIDILQTYALYQHVSFPTHVHGHWLDLFITRSTCTNIKAIFPTDGLSDHHSVIIDLICKSGQDIDKNYYINTVRDDVANSDLLIQPKSTLCELVNQYHENDG